MKRAPLPRLVPALLTVTVALTVAACQTGKSGSSDEMSGQPSPGATVSPPESFGPPPSPTQPPDTTPVVLDQSLLDILPEQVAGVAIEEDIDAAATALSDPALPAIASALDAGVAVDVAKGNLVYALVVKLKPGAFRDEFFRQWRDSFDEGACMASGGVVGHAQMTIDARAVYITNCAAGMLTYHLLLPDEDVLISASSVGEDRFGELLMDNLRVPS